MLNRTEPADATQAMRDRARAIAAAGSVDAALTAGTLARIVDTTLSEALVLGLIKQNVRKFFAIFGHGSTDLGEVLRLYEEAGVTRVFNCRNEIEMAHAATALRWQYGERSAVVCSIGPGPLQAFAASLAAASNGVGVYHIYGDETTYGEGYNMQQVPKPEQGAFGRIAALMGQSYVLHTPEALRDALRRGALCINHPYKAGPFFLLLPLNTQPQMLTLNVAALPEQIALPRMAPADNDAYDQAVALIRQHHRLTIKAGGGTRGFDAPVRALAEAAGAAVAVSPGATGVLPDGHPQYLHVGGSKGSISGNYAMAEGELIVVIGSRAVCQADCSGIGYRSAKAVININGDLSDATHYNNTVSLTGDIGAVIERLLARLAAAGGADLATKQNWLSTCRAKKDEWVAFKAGRYAVPPLPDPCWGKPCLTQPVAIKIVADFAKRIGAVKLFDAGDVQANGFQIVEDDRTGDTFTEAGASYMGFAVSALLAGAAATAPRYAVAFSGDGSFMMNPQVLIDAVEHGAKGMIVVFDNRRMAAISGLQVAQYGAAFKTNDRVVVDYVAIANAVAGVRGVFGGFDRTALETALAKAQAHDGLSLVHVPVYCGDDPRGGMGAYGDWNVGNWVENVQRTWMTQDI